MPPVRLLPALLNRTREHRTALEGQPIRARLSPTGSWLESGDGLRPLMPRCWHRFQSSLIERTFRPKAPAAMALHRTAWTVAVCLPS